MENYIDDSHIHEGHRQRMRAKLLSHGQRIFDTYELLEMLLYHVIPYKDTNPIAKRLLSAFGGLDGVLSAEREALIAVSGVGERTAEFISAVGELSDILGAEFMPECDEDFSDYREVGSYFVEHFKNETKGSVVILLLDNNMRLIEKKTVYELDYSSAGVRAKAFVDAAVAARASVVISAHNHPHGPCCPCEGDRVTNDIITSALESIGVLHAEHYVVSGSLYSSIKSVKGFTPRLLQPTMANKFLESIPSDSSDAESAERSKTRYDTRNFEYFSSLLSVALGNRAVDVADRLLSKFSTIENALCASEHELVTEFSEKTAFFIKIIAYVTSRRATDRLGFGRRYTRADMAEYLKALFIGDSVEKLYLMTFDSVGRLTGCELLSEGTVNSSELAPRKALILAVEKGARMVAIAHNHPLGRAKASSEDIQFTTTFTKAFSTCDIPLVAHFIVAGQLCEVISTGMMTNRSL